MLYGAKPGPTINLSGLRFCRKTFRTKAFNPWNVIAKLLTQMLNIQKGFVFTDTVICKYPFPQFLLGERKNFKNPVANQRSLKANLIAIYLDCHNQR